MSPQHQSSLIHWVHEQRWDVWPVLKVPPEIRFEGGLGMIKYTDGKSYLGKIIKITGNKKEMEQAEEKLHNDIKAKKYEVPTKRKATRTQTLGKRASTNDVRRAVGERAQLNAEQMEAKKAASDAAKALAAAQQKAEEEEQEALRKNVSRKLFSKNVEVGTKPSVHELLSDEDVAGDSDDGDEGMHTYDNDEMNINDNDDMEMIENDDAGKDDNISDDESNPRLKEFRNPNTEAFLEYLLKCFRTKPGSDVSCSPSIKLYAKPIEHPGQKMVHLKKGHNLMISKGARNVLVLDKKSQKSASNFVRKTLTQLYGKEQLMQMTAVGRKKDTLSISDPDKLAIYEFISEYTSSMTWPNFIKAVNKKCCSTKSSPKTKGMGKVTPEKQSPSKDKVSAIENDNTMSVIASPAKFRDKMDVTPLDTPLAVASPRKFQQSLVVTAEAGPGDKNIQVNGNNFHIWSGNAGGQHQQWSGYWGQQWNPHHQYPNPPVQYPNQYPVHQQAPYQCDDQWGGNQNGCSQGPVYGSSWPKANEYQPPVQQDSGPSLVSL